MISQHNAGLSARLSDCMEPGEIAAGGRKGGGLMPVKVILWLISHLDRFSKLENHQLKIVILGLWLTAVAMASV